MNNKQYILTGEESKDALAKQNDANLFCNSIVYMSRNKFLKKYGFSAAIFDTYIDKGLIPFHRTGKVIEVEEFRTLAILRTIESKNAEAARLASNKQKVDVKPAPIVLTGSGIKIRRKKLNA